MEATANTLRTRGSVWPRVCRDLVWVISAGVLAVGLGLLVNAGQPRPLPLIREWPDVVLVRSVGGLVTDPGKAVEIRKVGLDEAMAAQASEGTTLADARPGVFFELGHIAGAVSLPRAEFAEAYEEFAKTVPKERPLLVYCTGEDCTDSLVVAAALRRLGFANVEVYEGGWDEWEAAGLPTGP